jgi:hypothetical protein
MRGAIDNYMKGTVMLPQTAMDALMGLINSGKAAGGAVLKRAKDMVNPQDPGLFEGMDPEQPAQDIPLPAQKPMDPRLMGLKKAMK